MADFASPAVLDWRREIGPRGFDELRRRPAFWSVFCKVMSFSEMPRSRLGRPSEAGAVCVVGGSAGAVVEFGGDWW